MMNDTSEKIQSPLLSNQQTYLQLLCDYDDKC